MNKIMIVLAGVFVLLFLTLIYVGFNYFKVSQSLQVAPSNLNNPTGVYDPGSNEPEIEYPDSDIIGLLSCVGETVQGQCRFGLRTRSGETYLLLNFTNSDEDFDIGDIIRVGVEKTVEGDGDYKQVIINRISFEQ